MSRQIKLQQTDINNCSAFETCPGCPGMTLVTCAKGIRFQSASIIRKVTISEKVRFFVKKIDTHDNDRLWSSQV